jgi:DNA-binding MarR family transcriptional regulator
MSQPAGRAELVRAIVDGVAAVTGRHRCAVARRLHASGVSLGHLQVLWILQEHGRLPVSRVATMLGIGTPNATGLLDRMEQRGLVERIRAEDDRRVVYAQPTDLGRAAIADLDGWRADLVGQILAPLSDQHLAAIRDAIDATLATQEAE